LKGKGIFEIRNRRFCSYVVSEQSLLKTDCQMLC